MPLVKSSAEIIKLLDERREQQGMTYNQTSTAMGKSGQILLQAVRGHSARFTTDSLMALAEVLDLEIEIRPKPKAVKSTQARIAEAKQAARAKRAAKEAQVAARAVESHPQPDFTDPNDPTRQRVEKELDAIYESTSGWVKSGK